MLILMIVFLRLLHIVGHKYGSFNAMASIVTYFVHVAFII